jgi:glycosyltransferase involved in cell wall biosynthesis
MKILFITLRALEINSSVTISNIGLLKGLAASGHEVVLLTPKVSKEVTQYEEIEDLYDNIEVIRLGENKLLYHHLVGKESKRGFRKGMVNFLRYLYYKVSLYDNTLNFLRKADIELLGDKQFDIVISTSDPKTSHLFTKKLIEQGLKYKYWIQHWGDPLYYDITNSTWIPKWIIKKKERGILKFADGVIYVSPITAKSQKKLFPDFASKINFIPLPYDKEKIYKSKKTNDKITIGYFGDYNSKIRNIYPLYNFCRENINYELIIAGSTDITLEETENIKIFPRVNQQVVNELEAKCDILAIICNKRGTQIPGKIYYYSATNKSILLLLDGEYRRDIEEYLAPFNRFMICDNNEEKIEEYINNSYLSNTINVPCNEFSSESVANKIISLIENSK